jgi:hypothetical protein
MVFSTVERIVPIAPRSSNARLLARLNTCPASRILLSPSIEFCSSSLASIYKIENIRGLIASPDPFQGEQLASPHQTTLPLTRFELARFKVEQKLRLVKRKHEDPLQRLTHKFDNRNRITKWKIVDS